MVDSTQPRYNPSSSNNRESIVRTFLHQITNSKIAIPPYKSDTRDRDKALLTFGKSESLLSGVISSVVSRDKNRAWTLTGGVRLVAEYGRKLHSVDEYDGWRNFISRMSESYYSTNMGFGGEIGVDRLGIPQTIWGFDPTKLRLTGTKGVDDTSLYYYPATGKIPLVRSEYIHANSMPSVEEKFNGAGFCAVERALIIARLMIGLFQHQLEKLGVSPPKGIALFKGILDTEWKQALAQADEEVESKNYDYYKGILALFTSNTDAIVDLIGFSTLPENFELKDFIEIVLQAYALAFNYPVGEFWAISSGSFGRTGEHKLQQQQATAKGELEFALALQEEFGNWFLPTSVSFEFEQRNDSGDINHADLEKIMVETLTEMYHAGRGKANGEEPLFTQEQTLELFVQKQLIPAEWSEKDEDTISEDLTELRERVLGNPNMIARMAQMEDEPVIMYRWSPPDEVTNSKPLQKFWNWRTAQYIADYQFAPGMVTVLFDSAEEAIKRKTF